ncbi:MAG TPA: GNAT family N-acetyltransferase [Ktedonobacterales bacterium]|nr:GNAT family N-acetyltransferase [Ktedonobacterales bacterium]
MPEDRRPEALGRADVRRCGTLWVATPAEAGPARPSAPDTRIRAVAAGDTEALRRAMVAARADNPNLAGVRVRGGRIGYLVERAEPDAETPAGTVLSYGWIARAGDTVDDLGFPLEMPPSEGWIYDCATIPAARGRGLYTVLLRTLRAEFPRYGLERGWIGTEPRNWASQRGIARAGFQKVADIDWEREPATVFGAPGFPEAALFVVAVMAGDGERSRVLPEAGIPWVEAVLATADEGAEPEGLRAFREVYGEQIHWSRAEKREGEEQYVILRCGGKERTIAARAAFGEYARALDELAPGLPWLVK